MLKIKTPCTTISRKFVINGYVTEIADEFLNDRD